ncbi:hypothetical protein F0562_009204 [Nyssa sinensis]|uniref:(R)-mandelonitrile lyase n=1 Tax=Nyssa sinensis TaxID=561372 RepID=A0A5J5A096_9ASTE|nr:hypothetical protein F0562_009204 [Nyssa sinensis]
MGTLAMAAIPFVIMFFISLQSNIISARESDNQDLSYLKFVFNATEFPPEEEYDYIIVGGGTAGCPLAATLSTNYSVLLLERGGLGFQDPNVMREEKIFVAIIEANDRDSPAQVFLSEEGIRNARGRVLGGSSMKNAGFYTRADIDFYLRSGIAWDMSVVNKSYQWIEETIVFQPNLNTWQSSVREALLESGIRPDNGFTLDHKEGTKIGGTIFDRTGRRHGAVELLNKAEPKNLRVAIHATVERVLFSSSYSSGQSLPEDLSDYASIEKFCHETVATIWHYHGGCLAGKVVDNRLRVFGINALRIVDGSTFTTSPGTNPQATLLMLGRLSSKIIYARECGNQDLSYLKFVYNATEFPLEEEYDYIVVGGGTAGCPLAATLSTNYSVLLLERGGLGLGDPNVMREERVLRAIMEADDKDSPAQVFISEEGVRNARGRVLGGSSMINAGFYSRADMNFYMRSGIEWDMSVVNMSYQWIEENIVFRPKLNTWQTSVKEALLESGIGPDNGFTLDHKEGTKIGGTIFDKTGRRHGAVELLNKAESKNLRVAIHATVERVLFSSSYSSGLSAVGVVYSDSIGKSHQARVRATGEVILSAGAIGSPQLLLLSGVGQQEYLSSLNIAVFHHQPFVGKFVYDVPSNVIDFVPPFQVEMSLVQVVGITRIGSYIEAFASANPVNSSLLSIEEKISRTLSTGFLQLASPTNVRISPNVRYNYFANPVDLANCVSGIRIIGMMLRTRAMEQYKFQDQHGAKYFKFVGQSLPEDLSKDASVETFCRETLRTIWHYHGGCLVGKVVDNGLRVIGINALRIVDGSTFTVSPGTNPQATLLMLGRYAGLKMLEERISKG